MKMEPQDPPVSSRSLVLYSEGPIGSNTTQLNTTSIAAQGPAKFDNGASRVCLKLHAVSFRPSDPESSLNDDSDAQVQRSAATHILSSSSTGGPSGKWADTLSLHRARTDTEARFLICKRGQRELRPWKGA